ncbi:hypothetical protein EMIHUDRAFT_441159 [Emiliania huxleyi CCMP1516]|uniref:Tyrosine-protein phosphatase domain-containing protein n=2 Tax=Emiliania huxleyi TaxID=2903 RepID=A0A0D3KGK8_EMIH1|nr:hypothetical protein EMIHUDRAFT_441159 [Emiliania huxleyi CCMP1516]EOD34893.1 hypothetical protein EMIHUDRAFT_441159 [Emiliania huxleyi CCMP1516]|eukprot:XP_005787322.1 hypothetical protein EMIHUDRAFT_441159 [Emiliania huxleyi CCMP1516]
MAGRTGFDIDGIREDSSDEENEDVWDAHQIVSGLFIGGIGCLGDRSALAEHNIQFVLSLHEEQAEPPVAGAGAAKERPIEWLKRSITDRADSDLLSFIDKLCDAIELARSHKNAPPPPRQTRCPPLPEALAGGGGVLVACLAGASPSAAVVAAYLVKHRRMSLRAATERLSAARAEAVPNRGFWRQLVAFELVQRGCASFTEEELPGSVMFEQELLDKCIGEYLQKAKRRRPAAGEEEEEEEEGLVRPLFEDDEEEGVGVAASPLKRTRLDDPPILLEDAGRPASIEG